MCTELQACALLEERLTRELDRGLDYDFIVASEEFEDHVDDADKKDYHKHNIETAAKKSSQNDIHATIRRRVRRARGIGDGGGDGGGAGGGAGGVGGAGGAPLPLRPTGLDPNDAAYTKEYMQQYLPVGTRAHKDFKSMSGLCRLLARNRSTITPYQ